MRLAEAQTEAFSRQVIVDALAEMAETAGVSPDDAQAMMHAGAVSQWDVPIGMSHGTVTATDYADLLGTEFPPRKALLAPWLPSKGTAMIYGWRGLGKTFLVHASAWAIATGGGFLRWTTEQPRRMLVLDGEMPMAALQERFRAIEAGSALRPQPGYLRIAAADRCGTACRIWQTRRRRSSTPTCSPTPTSSSSITSAPFARI
jgi:AAA domain